MFPETSVIKTTRKERQLEDEIYHLNCRIVQLERENDDLHSEIDILRSIINNK